MDDVAHVSTIKRADVQNVLVGEELVDVTVLVDDDGSGSAIVAYPRGGQRVHDLWDKRIGDVDPEGLIAPASDIGQVADDVDAVDDAIPRHDHGADQLG